MGTPDSMAGSLHGVYAAIPTPFGKDGQANLPALDPVIDFLIEAGVDGLCVGGATGEYPACSIRERELISQRIAARAQRRVSLILGVGAGNAAQASYLANVALECGASAALLPPPFYFRYNPEDVAEFTRDLAGGFPLPALIYYIPQFTNPFNLADAIQLIEVVPNIVGIKDSSGLGENVPLIAHAKAKTPMTYFSGADSQLVNAYQHGADGAISGVAAACPELLVTLERIRRSGTGYFPDRIQNLLNEFVGRITALPVPWGIKLAMEIRGFRMGPLSWTGSKKLETQIAAFQEWFRAWLPACLETCSSHNANAPAKCDEV